MFKNENEPKDFILAPGHHAPTQKVSKWLKPPTLWNGLETQSAEVGTRRARVCESQSPDECTHY